MLKANLKFTRDYQIILNDLSPTIFTFILVISENLSIHVIETDFYSSFIVIVANTIAA